jgi:hypothetical protein
MFTYTGVTSGREFGWYLQVWPAVGSPAGSRSHGDPDRRQPLKGHAAYPGPMAGESGPGCKVDRVSEKYGLTAVDDRLRERRERGDSLRDLERVYNERVLAAAMESAGVDLPGREAATLYRLLTDDEVGPGERVDARSRLRRAGVDPATLESDFVSYQTVRTHLNDCLGLSTDRETAFGVDVARDTALKLVSRTELVTRQLIDRLRGRGAVTVVAPSVTVSVRVACSECGDEYSFSRLLDRGGCSCQSGRE